MKNYKTTLLSIAVALLNAGPDIANLFSNGTVPSVRTILTTIGIVLWGWFTKDKNVTGVS